MNHLDVTKRTQILAMLIEGNSIASTCRITGAAKNTVLKLLAEVGAACAAYQDRVMRKLPCKRVQVDEIWSFVGMKAKQVPAERRGEFGIGDVYTWTAIDADTKLIPCWHVGTRGVESAIPFIKDLAARMGNRIQLTSDGYRAYVSAVERAFEFEIDYAQLVKLYGNEGQSREDQRRYSPAECRGTQVNVVSGNPDIEHVSTSFVERSNLTMRMHMRRFTRLTNAFSKKIENHMHAVSLHFMFYNFCRIHKTLRVTPAMEAGLTDHAWDVQEIVEMTETIEKNFVSANE